MFELLGNTAPATSRDLTDNPKVQGLVARAFDAGLDLASICHGSWLP
jgi:putative intracellular protease/amidase